MNTSIRARHDARGFSFVELLVTIVIAGIVFAAMVPVFVMATQKTGADNARNVSTQLARDKVEKIRQLDYDAITEANLDSSTYGDSQFGTTWSAQTGHAAKPFHIDYTVTSYPIGSAPGLEMYKKVDVVVTWDAPPKPVFPAALSTIMYKQYAGPMISNFEIDPAVLEEVDPDTYDITGSPVTIDVRIASEDIASMNAKLLPINDTNKLKMGYVRFTVSSVNGSGDIANVNVYQEYNNEAGHYQFVWDNSRSVDGIYTIAATAYSSSQQEGTSASVSYKMAVTTPPPPANLAGTIGSNVVSLTWANSGIGDFDHYELWRSTPDQANWVLYADNITASPSYTDTAVSNTVTYYYKVCVVDTDGNTSLFSTVAGPLVPAIVSDTTPPTVPGSFTCTKVAKQAAISLTWLASTDPGSPSSGIKGYTLERKMGAGAWTQVLSADSFNQLVYTDTGLAWSTIYSYRVKALDGVNLPSAWSAELSATTDAQSKWDLLVNNTNTSSAISVFVQSVTTGLWWRCNGNGAATSVTSKPSGYSIAKKKSATWKQLPQDIYNVTTAGGGSQAVTADRLGLSVNFNQ